MSQFKNVSDIRTVTLRTILQSNWELEPTKPNFGSIQKEFGGDETIVEHSTDILVPQLTFTKYFQASKYLRLRNVGKQGSKQAYIGYHCGDIFQEIWFTLSERSTAYIMVGTEKVQDFQKTVQAVTARKFRKKRLSDISACSSRGVALHGIFLLFPNRPMLLLWHIRVSQKRSCWNDGYDTKYNRNNRISLDSCLLSHGSGLDFDHVTHRSVTKLIQFPRFIIMPLSCMSLTSLTRGEGPHKKKQ